MNRRQQAILDLVSRERLGSQQDIRDRLAVLGMEATQSTISRDVAELGLVKIHDPAGLRYVTPDALNGDVNGNGKANAVRTNLQRLLREYATSMESSGNILIVQTPSGAAHLLGEGLDRAHLEDVAGCVAGDTTILVVSREGVPARSIQAALTELMEENS